MMFENFGKIKYFILLEFYFKKINYYFLVFGIRQISNIKLILKWFELLTIISYFEIIYYNF